MKGQKRNNCAEDEFGIQYGFTFTFYEFSFHFSLIFQVLFYFSLLITLIAHKHSNFSSPVLGHRISVSLKGF